jgi:hypothetical protein
VDDHSCDAIFPSVAEHFLEDAPAALGRRELLFVPAHDHEVMAAGVLLDRRPLLLKRHSTNIADLMGHRDLATTQIYAKVEVEHLRDAISRLSTLVPAEEKKVSPEGVTRARFALGPSRKLLKGNGLEARNPDWLGGRDSNPDSAVQSRMSYH